jgi:Domain of unknown function (DUF5615)
MCAASSTGSDRPRTLGLFETAFDQNLSFELVPVLSNMLSDIYPGSTHVRDLRFVEADDLTIWRYAAERLLCSGFPLSRE